MARNVDQINITNWAATGSTVPVPQYSVDVEIYWTNDDGSQGHHGPETYLWPNVLADVPLKVVREFMREMIEARARVELGIDTWDMYE